MSVFVPYGLRFDVNVHYFPPFVYTNSSSSQPSHIRSWSQNNQNQNSLCTKLSIKMLHTIAFIILWFFFIIVVASLGITVGTILYKNINNEEKKEKGKVIQAIMKTYAIIQCIAWPCWTIFAWLLFVDKEMINLLSPTLNAIAIFMLRFSFVNVGCYVAFNSLVIATCRYCFIVFDNWTSKFGVGKARRIFISASVGIPLLLAFINEATIDEPTYRPLLQLFLYSKQSMNINPYNNNTYLTVNSTDESLQNPIYKFVRSYFPTSLTDGMRLFCTASFILVFANVGEGLMYLHTYIYYRR